MIKLIRYDKIINNLKLKTYRFLTGTRIKSIIKIIEVFCKENFPVIHSKIFITTKNIFKQYRTLEVVGR